MTTPAVTPKTLSDLRRASGLSLAQVADRMGVSKNQISKIEARYPNLNYETLTRYVHAIGGSVNFTVGTTHTSADQLAADPARAATRESSSKKYGRLVWMPSAPEELELQGDQPQTGGDDTGRDVDHADAQGDQGDSGQGEQPGAH